MPNLKSLSRCFCDMQRLARLDLSGCTDKLHRLYHSLSRCPVLETINFGSLPKLVAVGANDSLDSGFLENCPSLTTVVCVEAPQLLRIAGNSIRSTQSLENFDLISFIHKPAETPDSERCRICWSRDGFISSLLSNCMKDPSKLMPLDLLPNGMINPPFLCDSLLATSTDWISLMREASLSSMVYLVVSCLYAKGLGNGKTTMLASNLKPILLGILGVLSDKVAQLKLDCQDLLKETNESEGDSVCESEELSVDDEEDEEERTEEKDSCEEESPSVSQCATGENNFPTEFPEAGGKKMLAADAIGVALIASIINVPAANLRFTSQERDCVHSCFHEALEAIAIIADLPSDSLKEYSFVALAHGVSKTMEDIRRIASYHHYDQVRYPTAAVCSEELLTSMASLYRRSSEMKNQEGLPTSKQRVFEIAEYVCLQPMVSSEEEGEDGPHLRHRQANKERCEELLCSQSWLASKNSSDDPNHTLDALEAKAKIHFDFNQLLFDFDPVYNEVAFADVWVSVCCISAGLGLFVAAAA